MYVIVFFFFKQKTAYEMLRSLVGSEMCIRDSNGRLFHTKVFWSYLFNAVLHSAICFFGPFYLFDMGAHPDTGHMPDTAAVGILVYTTILFVVTGKVALETLSWTWLNVAISVGSLAVWFIFIFVYSQLFRLVSLSDFAWWFAVPEHFVPVASFWLIAILMTVIALLRDFVYKYYRRWISNAELVHVVQVLEHVHAGKFFNRSNVESEDRYLLTRLENLEPKVGAKTFIPVRQETGFAFAQESGQEQTMRVFQRAQVLRKAADKFKSLTSRKSTLAHEEAKPQRSYSNRSEAASVSPAESPSLMREEDVQPPYQ
eukprot:TRINITY_DN26211_c0_g1_i1.p1 TRINITY_DN26211_c0_g1~~TRINITY_DN26211_c0_g1_i1.p1  ORF type:complete len:314 (-),score=66.17 TRINITY_DN26211_c0_g1_i1:185-1126(-)